MLRNPASLSNYPTSTWTGLPAAASAQGQIMRVTDFGISGVGLLVISDGTRWIPLGPQVLARSAVAASVTGTTAETVLATVAVPAGLLGLHGSLRITPQFTFTNSANTKSLRLKYGGTTFYGPSVTTTAILAAFATIRNRGAAGSQLGSSSSLSSGLGTFASTFITSTVDSSVAQTADITGQLGLGTETATLEGYTMEVLP